MNCQQLWLVSEDSELLSSLEDAVKACIDLGATQLSATDFLSSDVPTTPPVGVIIDVRSFTEWDRLQAVRRQWDRRTSRAPVFFVAVIDERGFPLEAAAMADEIFSQAVECPCDWNVDFAQLVMENSAAEGAAVTERSTGGRMLECRGRNFVTRTPAMYRVFDDLQIAASHNVSLLLVGETGTGKTSIAQLIHDMSPNNNGPFLPVACGALPRELIDSELFGHVKGAFTGATSNKIGKFEAAHGGTILLDEIDVLTLDQQVKLLRVLESGGFEKLGSHETQQANARILVASNVRLETLVEQDRFRADLFFRLNQVKFEIPPLRERQLDITVLAMEILKECMREHKFKVEYVHPEFLELLKYYQWPGNIRELRNEIRRAALFCREGVITADCLTETVREEAIQAQAECRGVTRLSGLGNHLAKTEQQAIEEMLQTQKFNRAATARALGISRVTLYNKLRKYGIDVTEISRRLPYSRSSRRF